jgi:hypothetical protein
LFDDSTRTSDREAREAKDIWREGFGGKSSLRQRRVSRVAQQKQKQQQQATQPTKNKTQQKQQTAKQRRQMIDDMISIDFAIAIAIALPIVSTEAALFICIADLS